MLFSVTKETKIVEQNQSCVSGPLHLAHGSLDDGIKASLRGISVPGHHLLLHFLGEAADLLRQSQDVFVAKLRQAGGVNAVNERYDL